VFDEDVIRHYQAHLQRRRAAPPGRQRNTPKSPTTSGQSFKRTSTSAKSSWAALVDRTRRHASTNMPACGAPYSTLAPKCCTVSMNLKRT
jgi:hypothetical protein